MKNKDLQPRLLYPAKLSFRIKGHIKSLLDKEKLKKFMTTKPVLHEILESSLSSRRKQVKNMNNKMTINTHLTNKSKKLTQKQNRNRFMDTESVLMVARWEGDVGEWVNS